MTRSAIIAVALALAATGCASEERKAGKAAAALAGTNEKRVEQGMTYLRDTDDPFVRAQLTHLVKDPDVAPIARGRALRVLGQRQESVGLIARTLLDAESTEVRRAGIAALVDIGDPQTMQHIRAAAAADPNVEPEAAQAIAQIKSNAVERVLKLSDYSEPAKLQKEGMTPEQWVQGIRTVSKYIQNDDVPKFVRLYDEIPTSPAVRAEIVAALGRLDDDEAQKFVRSRLEAPEDLVRAMALSAVERTGDPQAVPLLRTMAESDPSMPLRVKAAMTVKRIEAQEKES